VLEISSSNIKLRYIGTTTEFVLSTYGCVNTSYSYDSLLMSNTSNWIVYNSAVNVIQILNHAPPAAASELYLNAELEWSTVEAPQIDPDYYTLIQVAGSGTDRKYTANPVLTDISNLQNKGIPVIFTSPIQASGTSHLISIDAFPSVQMKFIDRFGSVNNQPTYTISSIAGQTFNLTYDGTSFYLSGWDTFPNPTTDDVDEGKFLKADMTWATPAGGSGGGGGGATYTNYSTVLAASDWSGTTAPFYYSLYCPGATSSSVNLISPSPGATSSQILSMQLASLNCTGQAANTIYLVAYGTKPALDIDIVVSIFTQ